MELCYSVAGCVQLHRPPFQWSEKASAFFYGQIFGGKGTAGNGYSKKKMNEFFKTKGQYDFTCKTLKVQNAYFLKSVKILVLKK